MTNLTVEQRLTKLGTPRGIKDGLFQKILLKHKQKNIPWTKSDEVVWQGAIYVMPIMIGYILFATFFGWFFIVLYDKYGISRMMSFIAILVLWRLNAIATELRKLNSKL